jgi:hypothetical protein
MPPDANRSPVFSIDRNTLVPIGLLVAVVVSSISATVWINTQLLKLSNSIDRLDERVAELRSQVANGTADKWSRADMVHWVDLANASNVALKLPPPKPN